MSKRASSSASAPSSTPSTSWRSPMRCRLSSSWKMSPQQIGLVCRPRSSASSSARYAGWAAERWGRLTVTIGRHLQRDEIACAFAWDPTSLIVFRFIQGIGLGGEVPIANTYVNEIARAKARPLLSAFPDGVRIGLVARGVFGYLSFRPGAGNHVLCRRPAGAAGFLMRLLPESPRWLARRPLKEADRVVGEIEATRRSGKVLPPPDARAGAAATAQPLAGDFRRLSPRTSATGRSGSAASRPPMACSPGYRRSTAPFSTAGREALKYGMITSLAGILSALACAFFIDWSAAAPGSPPRSSSAARPVALWFPGPTAPPS